MCTGDEKQRRSAAQAGRRSKAAAFKHSLSQQQQQQQQQQPPATPSSSQRAQCFKTKRCRFWLEGRCSRGDNCTYAHTDVELRAPPDLTKTKICSRWRQNLCTKSADECAYAHGSDDLKPTTRVTSDGGDKLVQVNEEDSSAESNNRAVLSDCENDGDMIMAPKVAEQTINSETAEDYCSWKDTSLAGEVQPLKLWRGKEDNDDDPTTILGSKIRCGSDTTDYDDGATTSSPYTSSRFGGPLQSASTAEEITLAAPAAFNLSLQSKCDSLAKATYIHGLIRSETGSSLDTLESIHSTISTIMSRISLAELAATTATDAYCD